MYSVPITGEIHNSGTTKIAILGTRGLLTSAATPANNTACHYPIYTLRAGIDSSCLGLRYIPLAQPNTSYQEAAKKPAS